MPHVKVSGKKYGLGFQGPFAMTQQEDLNIGGDEPVPLPWEAPAHLARHVVCGCTQFCPKSSDSVPQEPA